MVNFYQRKVIAKTIFFIVFAVAFLFSSEVNAEVINNFDTTITVNQDSSILVSENITYDFEGVEKHGIFRTIPLKNYKNKSIKINVDSVVDESNNPYNFTTSISDNELTIKIGDADLFVNGIKVYTINYRVFNAIGYFDQFDEIYWNTTGNDWIVIIKKSQAKVILPIGTTAVNKACYTGREGAKKTCDILDSNIFSVENLGFQEGLTVAVSFPKGTVYEVKNLEKFTAFIMGHKIIFLPIIIFLWMYLKWRKNGKDPVSHPTIIAEYEPPKDMKPIFMGTLIDNNVDYKDITAEIIYLAQQGFIKIKRINEDSKSKPADYELELTDKDTSILDKIDKDLLILLFKVLTPNKRIKISEFKLYKLIGSTFLISDIFKELTLRGFYEKDPQKIKSKFTQTFMILLFVFVIISSFFSAIGKVSIVISLFIYLYFGFLMDKKTTTGSKKKDHILGFKLFLSVTEKDRLDFHNAPKKNPQKFMEFLPYAIALGIEKKWAEQFEGIHLEKPDWYSSASNSITLNNFASDLSDGFKNMSQTPSSGFGGSGGGGSSGGGSSGGGGGGGGGGSW